MESVLIGSIVKATLLLLAAFGLTALMRGTSAAARHAVWSATLVGVIVVPLASIALPWRMDVLPSGWGDSLGTLGPRAEGPALEELSKTPTPTPTPISSYDALAVDGRTASDPSIDVGTPSAARTGEGAASQRSGLGAIASDPWRIVLFAWLGIAAVILARILFGMAWMWRLARRAQPLSGPTWILPLGRVTERLDLRTAVRVVKSDAAAMPVTCGVLRPAIVLPEESEAWTEERKEAVLLHELAHVRRGDLATHLIAWIACSLYWFHPLVWIAARRLRHESERACDDLVLGAGTRASEYADHLLDIVRTAGRGRAPAAAVPMAQKSSFEGRLLAILEPGVDRKALSPRMKVAVGAALALVVLPLAAMAPAPPGLAGVEGSRVADGFDDPVDTTAIPLHEKESKSISGISSSTTTSVNEGGAFGLVEALDGLGPIHEGQAKTDNGMPTVAEAQVPQGTIDALETALDDADADVRRTAAEALGSLDDPRAVDALLEALRNDPDETVRKMAAWALGEIESPRAVAGLGQAVRSDRSTDVRAMAAWALGEIESPEGVDALGAALRDSSVEVRRMAVWGLGEIESAEAVEWLTPALRDEDVEIRRKAAWALGEIESAAAVPALGAAMGDADAEVRSMAAWALGEIESPAAVDALRAGVRDANVEVRRNTVWALGEIQDARGVAPLSQALGDEDREVRKTAAWALGEIQDPSAIPALRPLLQDSDAEIRKTAIWALVEMDDPAVYDILVELLKDEDPEVRKQAAHALGDM